MKIATIALAITATIAFSAPAQAEKMTNAEMCGHVETVAEMTIQAFQANVSLNTMMKSIDTNISELGEAWVSLSTEILLDAYDQLPYPTDASRAKQVDRFKNEWVRKCWVELTGPTA